MPAGCSAPAAEPWGLPAWGGERGTRDSSVSHPGRSLGSNLQINFQNSPGRWNLGSTGLGDGATTLVHPPWRPGPGDTLAPGVTLTYISAVCHRGLLEFVALGILGAGHVAWYSSVPELVMTASSRGWSSSLAPREVLPPEHSEGGAAHYPAHLQFFLPSCLQVAAFISLL